MLRKFLLLEAAVILVMVGTFAHQQLPATELSVGDATFVIREDAAAARLEPAPKVRAEPTTVIPLPTTPPERIQPADPEPDELVFPVRGAGLKEVISIFGDARGKTRSHAGIDIGTTRGTPVVAVADGFVERIREGGSGGRQLYLRDGRGRLFYYAHLDDWLVEEYQAVSAGDTLGTVGDTGNARGTTPHLHFEVLLGKKRRAVDPIRYWAHP
ncbi:M23 family metallopeptidase [Lewinella sp. IMCC34183]|uniref:M23 family metallopeptidase n=1 Tax=Lewinella sp. IMCC34183 TaxID=2248762 RepID=UPI001300BD32|nr:M23 family metallopeptidase [Lewinella sp. IMCC34183]